MIIPISNGRGVTPIYFPTPAHNNSVSLQQGSTNTQSNEPTLATWVMLGAGIILVIAIVVYFSKLLNDFGGKE